MLDRLNLFNSKDLEWLAWNWRQMMTEKMFQSRKQMVFENFNRFVPMLPSPEQILHGIILAQINEFRTVSYENDEKKLKL